MEYIEGYFKGVDDLDIYYRNYKVEDSIETIVISHGFCETSEKYSDFIKDLTDKNYSVYILDHRGHGKSGRLGKDNSQIYVNSFNDYVADLKTLLDEVILKDENNNDLILFGHSMGGAISALFLQNHNDYFKRAILNAPMLEIHTGNYSEQFTKIVAKIYCSLKLEKSYVLGHEPFNIEKCSLKGSGTSCEIRYNSYMDKIKNNEHLKLSGASYKWLNEAFKTTDYVTDINNIKKIEIPILLFQAGIDSYVKPYKQNYFAQNSKNCTLIIKENAKHEIYIEKDEIRDEYMTDLFNFLEE